MSITHEAYLNIVPGDSPAPIIKVSQYDADFSIVFHLIAKKRGIVPAYPRSVENDEDVTINVPTSATISVRGTKTDGNGYSANATLSGTATAPIVTVAGHEQMTASAGVNVYEITFYADDATKRLSTANFILFVEPAALDASTITSESLMLELNDLIASVPNAVAAADRAEAAAAQFEIDDTLTQQGKPADAKKVGDEISDIKADLSELGPGLSDEAKAALLACFNHVVWTDENGQDYYDALEDALYNSVSLRSITANYSPAGHVVYPYDTLDSLKSYIVVTAVYSDGTTQVVTDYTLSGNLDSSTSIITVAYQNKTAQVSVSVTIDSDLAYYVTRGTELNGVDSGFNTEYVPSDTNKAVTIICDFTDTSIVNRARSMGVVYNANNSSGYAALVISSASGSDFVKQYAINAHGAGSRKLENLTNASHRMRFAFTHAANSNYVYGNLYVDETTVCENVEMSANFTIDNTPLYVGKRPSGGYLSEGVINLFNIYNRVLTQSEIKNLLEVS